MIQIIGLLIAAYTFTRLLEICTTKTSHIAVRIIAVLSMIATVLLVFGLLAATPITPPGMR
jgi:hypothetical protein